MGVGLTKKLGGPACPNTNFMMQASRDQRKLLFVKENESALLNKLGPGPAKYSDINPKKIIFGERDKFTIPKVSIFEN